MASRVITKRPPERPRPVMLSPPACPPRDILPNGEVDTRLPYGCHEVLDEKMAPFLPGEGFRWPQRFPGV